MEQEKFTPEYYREVWQKESQQLQQYEFFSQQDLLQLIRSSHRSQYQRRCRTKNWQILLFVVLLLASLCGFYATLVFSHLFWIIVSGGVSLLMLVAIINCCYERYLLWRIHPYNRHRMDDDIALLSRKLNSRYERREHWLSYFIDNQRPKHHRIRWKPVLSTTLGGAVMVVVFCFIFPLSNYQNSQQSIVNAKNVICNKESCDAIKYCQITIKSLTSQGEYVQPQNH